MVGLITFGTVLLLSCTSLSEMVVDGECKTWQYLIIGENGIIQCSFKDFFGVSWYNSKENKAILFYRPNGVKTGEGFDSGEYDIYPNGSLLVRNVTVDHEGTFTVTKIISTVDAITSHYDIYIKTIVTPVTPYPIIDECATETPPCLISVHSDGFVGCRIDRSRPTVNLTWIEKKHGIETPIPSTYYFSSNDNLTFMSQTIASYSISQLPLLSLLVCRVSSIPNDLILEKESVILLDKVFDYTEVVTPSIVHAEFKSHVMLPCSNRTTGSIVWKQLLNSKDSWTTILYTIPPPNNFTEHYLTGIDVNIEGSLLLRSIELEQEGLYACIHQDARLEDIALTYDVKVYVDPVPAYPVVDGCNHQQYCVLHVTNGELLNCSIFGIRPEVNLEWKEIQDTGKVSFEDQRHSVRSNDDRFDVILTSRVSFSPSSENRITIECRVTDSDNHIFKMSTTMDLAFEYVHMSNQPTLPVSVILSLVAVVIIVVVIVAFLLRRRVKQRERVRRGENDGGNEERLPMVENVNECSQPQREISGEEKLFIDQLKTKYAILYDSVQPIPYIKDRMYCVDKVYVEVGIELLTDVTKQIWKTLNSYHELLTPTCLNSKRLIIEGEPGYGKSTLVLQVVYDWCNDSSLSALGDVDVIIYLRLRQLSGVTSISEAIKRFILPKDTRLSEGDIKGILAKVTKILILLDGYDEYPDQENSESFVHHILRKELLQEAWVILSTRNSCFPQKKSPDFIQARLTGFNEEARDSYITKAITGNNKEATEKIKRKLLENPVLGDLCNVPLLFVMFAHMAHENKDLKNFKSVTSFFGGMIECFHSHIRNKMDVENVSQFDIFENDHKMLDKIAFDGLNTKRQKIVWERKFLTKKLSKEFYNHYVRVGILVEEEVLYTDEGGIVPRYKWEVRFYHKLFCEWYAAYYLSRELNTISDLFFSFKYLDPYDLQYLFRFTCGLNKLASKLLIQHFQLNDHTKTFAVLCMIEQVSNHEVVLEQIQDLVSTTSTSINMQNTKLFQRSTIQILEIACKSKIKICSLVLENSFRETENGDIILISGLGLPSLPMLENLEIRADKEAEITPKNVLGLISYGSTCTNLKAMKFSNCTLRSSYPTREIAASLKSNSFDVHWFTMDVDFQLNFQSGQWEMDFISSLSHICSKDVHINKDETIMQQSSTIQLLKLASDQNISIHCVTLDKCFDKVDEDEIRLKSGLTLPRLLTMKKLQIQAEKDRNLIAEDFIKIITYGIASQTLRQIFFVDYMLPTNIPLESIPAPLIERNIPVHSLVQQDNTISVTNWISTLAIANSSPGMGGLIDFRSSDSLHDLPCPVNVTINDQLRYSNQQVKKGTRKHPRFTIG